MKRIWLAAAAAVMLVGCKGSAVPQTGINEEGELLVVYSSDGLVSDYRIEGDSVIQSSGVFFDDKHPEYVGRRFQSMYEGECTLVFRVKEQASGGVREVYVFDVAVDGELEISYESRTTNLLPLYDVIEKVHAVTILSDSSYSIYGDEVREYIAQEAEMLFGTVSDCTAADAQTDEMNCITVDYTSQEVQYTYDFWFGDGSTAYICRSNENGLEEWQVCTLDEISSFDGLRELIAYLDGVAY